MAYSFQTPVDVANRALQLLGATAITSLSDNSRNAAQVAACYDKVRQSELARNVWRFAVRRALLVPLSSTAFRVSPPAFNSGQSYPQGAIVQDASRIWWQSMVPNNVGNTPGAFVTGQEAAWAPYAGPRTADLFSDASGATPYLSGQIAYETPAAGGLNFYSSLLDNNTDDPSAASVWSATQVYGPGDIVAYGGFYYRNLLPYNIGNEPDLVPGQWQSTITYGATAVVTGYDGKKYESLISGNTGHNPVSDTAEAYWNPTGALSAWTPCFQSPVASLTWVPHIGMGVDPRRFIYPIGAGPVNESDSKNVFLLPANFLRMAPQHPKQGLIKWLGGPAWNPPDDWVMENDCFTSYTPNPILFRFVADVQDVSTMDPMFCEGLACRVAMAICEALTQSPQKFGEVTQQYMKFMSEARIVNAIEEDSIETPQDEYVTVRL